MINIYKVLYEDFNGGTQTSYYKSTSISVLLYWLGYHGAAVGNIIEIKRISRLPKYVKAVDAM